ncbi:MAG: TIGR01459 family HAD-type hydrolase [Alphaproteobacteria bacterium]|nr:TIGR01459 family HAD-type hydrolase [Alphaproteobacteria bacterium]
MSKIITNLESIVEQYDAFVIDLWGVIHDGRKPYQWALEVLGKLKELNKTTLLLSNSPRRVTASVAHLENMGLSRKLYTHIYTSGEDTHQGLKNRPDEWHQKLGSRLYHIGPDFHKPIYAELPYEKVTSPTEADFLLATGAESPTLQEYEEILNIGIEHNLPMLCANPDRVIVQDGKITLCCGSIAERYEQLGGDVFYHGKPYPAIYQPVLSLLKEIIPSRILAIGDSLTTDIKGAQTQNIDGALVMSGIHHEALLKEGAVARETIQLLQNLTSKVGTSPRYALKDMIWTEAV